MRYAIVLLCGLMGLAVVTACSDHKKKSTTAEVDVRGIYRVIAEEDSVAGTSVSYPFRETEDKKLFVVVERTKYIQITDSYVRTYLENRYYSMLVIPENELSDIAERVCDSSRDLVVTTFAGAVVSGDTESVTVIDEDTETILEYRSGDTLLRRVRALNVDGFSMPMAKDFSDVAASVHADDLAIHLDAGNVASYSGTGDVWKDLSTNGNHFNLGYGSGPDSRDPGFSDGAFSMGNAFFTKSGSNGSYINSIHKPGARFTIELWVYIVPNPGVYYIALGTTNNASVTGFRWFLEGALGGFGCVNPAPEIQTPFKELIANGSWQQVAVSIDTVAGTGFTLRNGRRYPRNDSDFSVPTWGSVTGDAPNLMRIGTQTNDSAALWPTGSRLAIVRMYADALSEDELRGNYLANRSRFGLQ